MNIKWTTKLLTDLHNIVSFIKMSEIGDIFEEIYLVFTKKNEKYGLFCDYSMEFLDAPENPDSISRGEYHLAFLCQIVNRKKTHFHNPYRCLSDVIHYFVKTKFQHKHVKTNNEISYVVSLLTEIWPDSSSSELQNTVNSIQRVISVDVDWSRFGTLYNNCELIDLSILPEGTGRNILEVLGTRRTFYLRLLLLTAQEVVRERIHWSEIHKKIFFASQTGMKLTLSLAPVIITLLLSRPIIKRLQN